MSGERLVPGVPDNSRGEVFMTLPISRIETAEEHLRNALQILTVAGVDIVTATGRQWVYQDQDITAIIHRLERALVQVAPMPYPPESNLPF